MISRVAEACFWMLRHAERQDNLSRLLGVNQSFFADAPVAAERRWAPLVVVTGEWDRFVEQHGEAAAADGERVQEHLVWGRDCPVSIRNCAYWARENARSIREVISLELWEAINAHWRWIADGQARAVYDDDRDRFYRRIGAHSALLAGLLEDTILHSEAHDFMLLGKHLERAGQTARILDVMFHRLGGVEADDSALAAAQWTALLRSCSATEAYLKSTGGRFHGPAIAAFVVLGPELPRSVLHNVRAASAALVRIRRRCEQSGPTPSMAAMDTIRGRLESLDADAMARASLHGLLTELVDGLGLVCVQVHEDYFAARLPEAFGGQGERAE